MSECIECKYNGGMGGCVLKKCKKELFTEAAMDLLKFCSEKGVPASIDISFELYAICVYMCGSNSKPHRTTHTLFADFNIKEILKIKESLAAWTKA